MAYVTVPLTQILFAKLVSYQMILIIFVLCTFAALLMAHHFYSKV